jgi:hypothetical protein
MPEEPCQYTESADIGCWFFLSNSVNPQEVLSQEELDCAYAALAKQTAKTEQGIADANKYIVSKKGPFWTPTNFRSA